jgi:hypothetical protein
MADNDLIDLVGLDAALLQDGARGHCA